MKIIFALKSKVVLCAALLMICACTKNANEKILSKYNDFKNKQIVFYEDMRFVNSDLDTINISPDSKLKIVHFVDSIGCLGCRLNLSDWNDFMSIFDSCNDLRLITIINPHKVSEAQFVMKRDNFALSVCIDLKNDFYRINRLPEEKEFHCFLLDEDNRVILIGNPVQNPKIRELYIRTICERLGVERPNDTNMQTTEYHANMGTFPWQEAQQARFTLRNTEHENMTIDSIRTSCECTTATASHNAIVQGDSAVVTVTYRAEQAGDFMREVYVYVQGGEPITLQVEGRAE